MVQHGNDHSGEENADERDSGSLARIVRLISGEYLLTVNPVDGSEIEPCPPGRRPETPRRRAPADRAGADRSGADGSGADGSGAEQSGAERRQSAVLLEREEERDRLARLLGRGRSVRLTGPRGSGRTALLDAVATDVAELAPDGVVRLSGYRRTVTDMLHDLFAAVYDAPDQRPDRRRLRETLSAVGAVVIVDDLEFGGGTLDELLTATPECAYLVAATADVAAPSEKAHMEEVFLPGLSRTGSVELLEGLLDRPLTDDESDWAGDLWFLSEGKPLTFVQAAVLLRQQGGGTAVAVYGDETVLGGLPSGTDIAADVAAGLSGCARDALRVAVALGGELPKGTHLPALLNADDAEEAPVELADAGLVTWAGGHFRLAHGVADRLGAAYEDGLDARAETAAHHYTWWVAHPSVSAARVAAEADAVVATVAAAQRGGKAEAAVQLARAAAPVLAAASRWGAWERVLRSGQEAARTAGEVAEQAYFHHELGVLALCQGNPERARTELDASIALRAALADKHGTVAGRRALALVTDRLAAAAGGHAAVPGVTPGTLGGPTVAGTLGAAGAPGAPGAPTGPGPVPAPGAASPGAPGAPGPAEPTTSLGMSKPAPAAGVGAGAGAVGPSAAAPDDTPTAPTPKPLYGTAPTGSGKDEDATAAALSTAAAMDDSIAALRAAAQDDDGHGRGGRRGLAMRSTRKNVLAAGAGAVLAAVLGTVVTLGAASDSTDDPAGGPGHPDRSNSLTDDYDDDPADPPSADSDPSAAPADAPATPGPTGEATPSPTPVDNGGPADDSTSPAGQGGSTGGTTGDGTTGGDSGGTTSGSSGGTSDGGADGGIDGGGSTTDGGADGGSESDGGTTQGGTDGGGGTPTPTGSESPEPTTTPSGTTEGSDGASSPTASGPAPSGTPIVSPTGTASGGTGGEVA